MESPKFNQNEIYLGSDQLFEIFSWLPAKSIIKHFSSVSKTLSTLLSEPSFLVTQSIHSSRFDGGFFLQPDTCWSSCDNLDFHVLPREPPSLFGIPNESLRFLQQNGRVLASSQGLVLLHKFVGGVNEFLVCNPVMKSCKPLRLPEQLDCQRFPDFGVLLECHPRKVETCLKVDFGDDYTIATSVLLKADDDPWGYGYRLAVYSNGKWDDDTCDLRVNDVGRQLCLDMPVGVFRGPNGGLVVNYLCESLPNVDRRPVCLEPYMAAYDVERKVLHRTFKLPKGAWTEEDGDCQKLKIFKWKSSETVGLVRSDQRKFTVWVLEDYERVSWRMVVEKTMLEMGVSEDEGDVVGCCVVNKGGLVFATKSRVYEYEMEGPEAGRLEVVGEHGCREVARVVFTPYANTLRPVCEQEASVVTF